ncbi:hypothetical protein M9458_017431, partial [Cirrhinus mrigala]
MRPQECQTKFVEGRSPAHCGPPGPEFDTPALHNGYLSLAREIHFPAEFSSNPNQTHLSMLIGVFRIIRKPQVGSLPYTNDCTSKDPSVKLLKFAVDTTLNSLILDGDESAYRQEVTELAVWCSYNNLELNTLKTVEMIVDFRRNYHGQQYNNSGVIQILGHHHLSGPEVGYSHRLQCFLHQLRKFNLPQELLTQFYSAVTES